MRTLASQLQRLALPFVGLLEGVPTMTLACPLSGFNPTPAANDGATTPPQRPAIFSWTLASDPPK